MTVRMVAIGALIAHLVLGVFPYLASTLLAPTGGVALLMALWLALLAGGVWLYRNRPRWTPAIPVAAVAVWLIVVTIGDAFLDWTA